MEQADSLAILKAAGTAAISDIFDKLGVEPPVLDNRIQAVGTTTAFAGPAYTVSGESLLYTGSDRLKLEAIDNMTPGCVAVWAGQDAEGVCCFGDLLATAMRARGVKATVVDGGVRDVRFLEQCGLPVVARYRTPAQGVGRWKVTGYEKPVRVRGALREWVSVAPGDLVIGDADGVIVVPAGSADIITKAAGELSRAETEARREIAAGLPLLAALAKYGQL